MRGALLSIRDRLDHVGIYLSGLCMLHCILGLAIVSALGLSGGALLAPHIHEIGLALAVAIGAFALGAGFARHGRSAPMALGALGLLLMTAALAAGHGIAEAVLTICGVSLLAGAHLWNLRGAH